MLHCGRSITDINTDDGRNVVRVCKNYFSIYDVNYVREQQPPIAGKGSDDDRYCTLCNVKGEDWRTERLDCLCCPDYVSICVECFLENGHRPRSAYCLFAVRSCATPSLYRIAPSNSGE